MDIDSFFDSFENQSYIIFTKKEGTIPMNAPIISSNIFSFIMII